MSVPKFAGRDCELSTTGRDEHGAGLPAWEVTRAVLAHVDAAFEPRGTRTWSHAPEPSRWGSSSWGSSSGGWSGSSYSTDCLRNWGPSGQCYYADLGHVEVCTAETTSPRTFAAQCLSVLQVAEAARRSAEAAAPPGTRYALSAANVDMLDGGTSWGTHLNLSTTTALWEDLFTPRHPPVLGYVASVIAATVPFFGAGALLPLDDGTVVFSLSGRTAHLNHLATLSTTERFARGLLNSRREAHGTGMERLHLIGFDFALIGAAPLLSVLQCALAAAEEGYVGPTLYDPVGASRSWSLGLDLRSGRPASTARAVGRKGGVTLPAFVRAVVEPLLRMVDAGFVPPDHAPEAREQLERVLTLADAAERGDLVSCARHLDWAAKLLVLLGVCERRGVALDDAAVRLADHDFASTDPGRGALWRLWREDAVDPLVTPAEVDACLDDGPPEGRGWVRGRLVREFADEVAAMNWDHVELRPSDGGRWEPRLRVKLPQPGAPDRACFEPLLAGLSGPGSVEALRARLATGASPPAELCDPARDLPLHLASPERFEANDPSTP